MLSALMAHAMLVSGVCIVLDEAVPLAADLLHDLQEKWHCLVFQPIPAYMQYKQ